MDGKRSSGNAANGDDKSSIDDTSGSSNNNNSSSNGGGTNDKMKEKIRPTTGGSEDDENNSTGDRNTTTANRNSGEWLKDRLSTAGSSQDSLSIPKPPTSTHEASKGSAPKEEQDIPGDDTDSKDINRSRGPLEAVEGVSSEQPQKGRQVEVDASKTSSQSSVTAGHVNGSNSGSRSISSRTLNPSLASVSATQSSAAPPPRNTSHSHGTASNVVQSTTVQRDEKKPSQSNQPPKSQTTPTTSASASSKTPSSSLSSIEHGKSRPKDNVASVAGRAKLEALYSPFFVDSDTSLDAARRRLEVAIDQTRQLRAAFTERVYGKYRVCLKPPPQTSEIIAGIKSDPQKAFQTLDAQMKKIAAEKEVEKKEAAIMNSELPGFLKANGEDANPFTPLSVDNAEQLMYVTTGLDLVILPEADANREDLRFYDDRGPFDPVTGNRLRCINQSSAAASGTVLDRCRQALRLKSERDRRKKQQQARASDGPNRTTSTTSATQQQTYSRLSIISTRPSTTTSKVKTEASRASTPTNANGTPVVPPNGKIPVMLSDGLHNKNPQQDGAKTRPPTLKEQQAMNLTNARAIRARVQAGMTLNTLLSINPYHEELRTDGKVSTSTVAIMDAGVGGYFGMSSKKAPLRYKHPFPDSIGSQYSVKLENAGRSEPLEPLSLPPLSTVKERRRARRMEAAPCNEGSTVTAASTIRRILDQFDPEIQSFQRPRKRKATDISLMRSLKYASSREEDHDDSLTQDPIGRIVNPKLALNVMKVVGLIQPTSVADNEVPAKPFQASFNRYILDPTKMKDRGVLVDSGPYGNFLQKFERLGDQFFSDKRIGVTSLVCRHNVESHHASETHQQLSVSIMHIRGGGGEDGTKKSSSEENNAPKPVSSNQSNNNSAKASGSSPSVPVVSGPQTLAPQQRTVWDGRSQQILQAQIAQAQAAQIQGQLRSAENYSHVNTFQLAHQLRMSAMPQQPGYAQAGDLSDYINRLNQSQQVQATHAAFHWNTASTAAAAALAMNQHHQATMIPFALQQQNFAAQAAAAQQQQAAALLSNSVTSNTFLTSGYATLGGNILNQSTIMSDRSGARNLTAARTTSPSLQNQSGTASQAPSMKNVQPDLEQAPSSDLEPVPIDERSVKKVQGSVSKKLELSKTTGDAERNVWHNEDRAGSKRMAKEEVFKSESSTDHRKRARVLNDDAIYANPVKKPAEVPTTCEHGKKMPVPVLQFLAPPTPASIGAEKARLILAAKCHEAIGPLGEFQSTAQGEQLVSYLKALGSAVPIPEGMVCSHLKERLNAPAFKNSGVGSIPALSQGIITAVILHWLWRTQEATFQRIFLKVGRVDQDPESQWLVQAALDKAVEALSKEVADAATRATSPLAVALLAHKNKNNSIQGGPPPNPAESLKATTTRLDLLAASIVSRALNVGFVINEQVNSILPHFQDLLEYLDDCRKCALFCRSQERVLLAALVARKSTMSFNFSHAYVSAMVRAGEALGHGEVFEAAQNEKVGVSTMIPYDVFTDESGAWEDPCRPDFGYNEQLTGDELMRRAHARAMIQKSLKKLQDRHRIKGGTPIAGPYTDQNPTVPSGSGRNTPSSTTPRGRRRSSLSEPPIQPGTGAAPATSWALYDPKHVSEPLEHDSSTVENSPYGIFDTSTQPRSLSHTQGATLLRHKGRGSLIQSGGKGFRKQSPGHQLGISEEENEEIADDGDGSGGDGNDNEADGGMLRSTREIPWKDVAGIFQRVQLPVSTKDKNKEKPIENAVPAKKDRTILAPFVRKVDSLPDEEYDDESDSEEEDLSDEAILERHRVVLERMKQRLAVVLESRKRVAQDRRKNRGR